MLFDLDYAARWYAIEIARREYKLLTGAVDEIFDDLKKEFIELLHTAAKAPAPVSLAAILAATAPKRPGAPPESEEDALGDSRKEQNP